jgi:hypothetical protein
MRSSASPAPQSGRRSSSSGRAMVTMKIGLVRDHSSRCSMKSNVPESAQCRSSNTSATSPVAAMRSKKVRHAPNSCSGLADSAPMPRSASRAGSIQRRSVSSGTCSITDAAIRARVVASSSSAASPARRRIISPSAQNVMPSPYDGERPVCHHTDSRIPSVYFENSQPSRLFPMPAGPTTLTRRMRPSRPVAWKRSLSSRSSSSRPTNGASSVSERPRPPTSATTRIARQAGSGAALPFSSRPPADSKAIAALADRMVCSSTRTVPGSATPCSRDAVLMRSPATMPWFVAFRVTAASPVRMPARAWMPGPSPRTASTSSSAARTLRSASSSRAVGAPQSAMTASPMNFSTVPP